MTGNANGNRFALASPDDVPVQYMQRTRDWYLALGYGNPYRWAHFADVPFAPLKKPLAEATVALLTTAALVPPGSNAPRAGAAYSADLKFYDPWSAPADGEFNLRINHVAIDYAHTTQEDQRSFFPLDALHEATRAGRIGRTAPRVHGAPTNRSQRTTIERDAPDLVARVRDDGADAAILVPNCPVCHQTMAIVARALEADGIATVLMGCAKDIVEHAGVPRFLFSDFPLGNAAGRPNDPDSQRATLALALDLLEAAPAARTTLQSPLRWSDDPAWKDNYANAAKLTPDEIARQRAANEAVRIEAKAKRIRNGD